MKLKLLLQAIAIPALAVALIPVGCAGIGSQRQTSKGAAVEAAVSDREIGHALDSALVKDPATPADRIDVSSKNGIIALQGSVTNILAKERAEAIAQTVRGVRAVINKIEVTAPSRTDIAVKQDVVEALSDDPATEAYEVGASVVDGVVILTGSVDSWQEKKLAAKVAMGVRGVEGIDNRISVDYETDRSDVAIQHEIEKALRWDAYVDDALINVSVADGAVILSGAVGSMAEKVRARRHAWVAGVRSVDDSELLVKLWSRDEMFRRDKYVPAKTASQIEEAIRAAFSIDPRVDASEIDIEVREGFAILRGKVDDLKEKRAAADDARNVVGVWAVENWIKVVPTEARSARRIEKDLAAALGRDPYVERYDISVSVSGHAAYLYGVVDSMFEKARADDIASRQTGIVKVHNFLTVKGDRTYWYDPYVEDASPYHYDWYEKFESKTARTDWEIREAIRDELFWSPFVDEDEVTVAVDDGIAELTGTVDTWRERRYAREKAKAGGAVIVDNDLRVDHGPDFYRP